MTRNKLIFTDLVFIVGVILLCYATDFFHKSFLPIFFLILFAFASCVKRHADYYKLTKKIY